MNGKINVGSNKKVTIDGEKVKEKINLETFKGDNPLMLGSAGYTFPAKTLLKDGLQIINGVNGEDLTDTVADQTTAVEDLLKMVNRKIAMNNGEGQYVWKKLTAEDGDFIDYVVSSDTGAFPDGGTQDGYWYELVEEGKSGIDFGTFTLSSNKSSFSVQHNLGVVPSFVVVTRVDAENTPDDYDGDCQHQFVHFTTRASYRYYYDSYGQAWSPANYGAHLNITDTTISFTKYNSDYLGTIGASKGQWIWFAVA